MKKYAIQNEVIPPAILDPAIDGIEKVIFPHEAKTIWGKIARIGFKILRIFAVNKIQK